MHHCFSFSFLPTKHKIIFYYVERKKKEKYSQKVEKKRKKTHKNKTQASSFGLLQYFTGGKTWLIFIELALLSGVTWSFSNCII